MGADVDEVGLSERSPLWRRRWVRIVVGALGALVLLGAAGVGWRWRADRALVGTDVAAELTWGACLNGIFWTDPIGGEWWAGHDLVTSGDYESEPLRVHPQDPARGSRTGMAVVSHHSIGTVRVDSYERATFTSRAGGMMQLQRVVPNQGYTADCVGGVGIGAFEPGPQHYAVALYGVVAMREPGADADRGFPLVASRVTASVDGEVVYETSTDDGRFVLYMPVLGTITVEAQPVGGGRCPSKTMTVINGVPDMIELLCDPP